ncbi:hypothetical protein CCH79_00005330 [Gambusia affinis]|uniref:Laminin subunit alpha-3 n=1 Tax=Gambusia affinis TaxID=33528 RepID=A0A315VNZ3_GAMAF|nr:hypothetical protein CCH79_00005330 [Gambusia affinis]
MEERVAQAQSVQIRDQRGECVAMFGILKRVCMPASTSLATPTPLLPTLSFYPPPSYYHQALSSCHHSSCELNFLSVHSKIDKPILFHVAYILIKFANSPRPDLWVLERSVDNGRKFTPWQYFAHTKRECIEKFGKQPNGRIFNDDDQICTTEYSRIIPLENGEIVVSLINGRPGSKNFTYSPVLRDFTKATNIRLRFLRTSTLLGHLISKAQRDPTVTRRTSASVVAVFAMAMPRLQCECQHNTCGESCDRCCPGFNQKPWRAATVDSPNDCQPCQCFTHASDCYYDPEVEKRRASLDIFGRYSGGGVCIGCQHNTAGINCERCIEGFYRPFGVPPESPTGCRPCSCDERITAKCEMGSGRCICKPQFAGESCDRCADGHYRYPECIPYSVYLTTTESPAGPIVGPNACPPGYFNSPRCQPCICDYRGTVDAICDVYGRCLCRWGVEGERCDRCEPGYYAFPNCQACRCGGAGVAESMCSPNGQCNCLPNYQGLECDQCAPGFYGYPDCAACRCSSEGSYGTGCNALSGECLCLPGVVGQQCDRCASGLRFPQCSESIRVCNPDGSEVPSPLSGICRCRANVEGTLCDRCKPLYWNLAADNPRGCTECQCDLKGTLSGVGECEQRDGQCHCKPNVCSNACDSCKDGYYLLQKKKYFGCQACQCDLGGAVGMTCHQTSGQCQCRENLKFEVEDGTTPNSRPVRFGFNPQEFPEFSWRGYAVMSPAQSEARVTVHVDPKKGRQNFFHVVLRFINPNSVSVTGSIEATNSRGTAGEVQSKEVIFPPRSSPSFVTVPGEGFTEPYALNPGKWIIHIRAEGVLLDYLVLLPRDYYEASLLKEEVTQPCTYLHTANKDENCLLHKHITLDGFSSVLATQGRLSTPSGQRKRRQVHVRRPTPDHPDMAALNKRQSRLELSLRVPHSGLYTLILEYASEMDTAQNYKIYAVPAEEFSLEYVEPKVLCVSTHGRFTQDSRHCVQRRFDKPSSSWVLYATRDGQLSSILAAALQQGKSEDWRRRRQSSLFSVHDPQSDGTVLKFPQTEISFTPAVPLPGRYVVVVHYHQPEHASFPVEVRINAGLMWKGEINATFCPAVSGCREVVVAEGRIALDFYRNSAQPPSISVIVPHGKTLVLDYIVLVPDSSYSPEHLQEKPLDKPRTSSQFCRDSARALVAAYNDGALPCDCDKSGSTGAECDPVGGQCPCRQHVIGRQCNKCATGYYGFPYCKPCECSRRLCDEVTGRCICPPQTVKPTCDACQYQTFSYHPLLGCESCGCSPTGVNVNAGLQCDAVTGQCSCKPRIGGRQCDRCAQGYYRFPDCLPCECNRGGVTAEVCHPDTGRCLCKKNVDGVRCDTCREGSFYFDPSNLLGCSSCFCFEATNQCRSSNKRRGKFVEMLGWRLESPDREEVPSVLNAISNTAVADIQELPATVQTLHWVAPQSYLGDRVSSYGGFLTYQSKSFGIPSEGMTLIDRQPDVLLTGQTMSLIHVASQAPLPDRVHQGRVQLLEGNWRHAGTNRPVSRQELMMVLAGLVGLRIRALYFTQTQRLSLGEVGLEEATESGTGGPANTVEVCSCPTEYTGDSCELNNSKKCAPGFYRKTFWLTFGQCLPCECNGLADECEDETGRCLNCKYNTAGDQCEKCKDGYFGIAAKRTCRLCPCPLISCKDVFGDIQCSCKPGYTGVRCESCAPGYYGDPQRPGGNCQPCNCNGNGNSCDPRTGVCKNSLEAGDTNRDEHCQECDNCAQTLLNDLEKLDIELARIRAELDNASISGALKKSLDKLEKDVSDTKALVNKFSSAVKMENSKVDQLEKDVNSLAADIKSMEDKSDQNEAAAEKIRSQLKDYNAKLKDLEEALEEARNLKRIDDLKEEQKTVQNQIAMAEDELKKTEDLVKMLSDRKTEYEGLAAQLDGAKTDLTKKVNEITKAAAQKDLVEAAEEHAKKLSELAKQIENALKNASELPKVQDAKDAIEAYKNITDAIKAAEAAAKEAKDAADKALDIVNKEKLTDKAKELKDKSSALLKDSKDSETYLQDTASYLNNLTNRLAKAKEKKNDLKDLLSDVQRQLDDTNRDAIGDMIEEAKRKATSANNTAADTMDKLNKIRKEIDKISVSPANANLSNDLNEADQTVKDLLKTIPSLNDKISEVENLTSGFSGLGNISENIMKIKELIEQARDAADKIAIPMNFNGEGHVELRPPKNLDDLKAYTTLSLLLQRPMGRGDGKRRRRQAGDITDMFVLYFGNRDVSESISVNYIGMVLRKNRLYGLYKLNGQEYELESDTISTSNPQPATFDKVDLHRIYQDVELKLTKDITSGSSNKLSSSQIRRGVENQNLLKFSPDDVVFYVGGYPSNFTPPPSMKLPKYTGCIEFSTFNRKAISLYNFQKNKYIMVTVEKGYIVMQGNLISETENGTEKVFPSSFKAQFNLGSSLKADLQDFSLENNVAVSLGFKTTETQGIILQNKKLENQLNIAMENGYVILHFDTKKWKSNKQYNDGNWHYVTATKNGGRIALQIDDEDYGQEESGTITIPNTNGSILLGKENFKGCISNFYTQRPEEFKPLNLNDFQATGDVQIDVCTVSNPFQLINRFNKKDSVKQILNESASVCEFPAKLQHAYRMGGPVSSLSYSLPLQVLQPKPHFSLDVRTRSPEGLLFFAATRGGQSHLALYMSKGRIRLSVGKQREIFNREKYNDGKWHSVNDSFFFGSDLELLFNIRPRSQTGLLLYVGDSTSHVNTMGHFLSIYMLGGEVVAHVNNGRGEYMTSVKPKTSLCDGIFHKISVIKRKNVVQLSVDTLDNYKIGPPSSTFPLTKDPLYVAGIPETLMQQMLPVTSSFVGCIQDMKINDVSVSFHRSSGVFGPVNLKECPG